MGGKIIELAGDFPATSDYQRVPQAWTLVKICEDGNLYSCCLWSEIRIPILLVGFPYYISFRRCSRFETGTRKFDAQGMVHHFIYGSTVNQNPGAWRPLVHMKIMNVWIFLPITILFLLYMGRGQKYTKTWILLLTKNSKTYNKFKQHLNCLPKFIL